MNKDKLLKIAKVAIYVGISAVLDYLISITSGSEFGTLTPIINVVLVTVRQAVKKEEV